MKVSGKVMVVTGAGNGIGRELVFELLSRGARVAAADLRTDSLEATAELARAGDRLALFTVDVSDAEAVAALPAAVVDAFGTVDGIINNAGIIQRFVSVADLDDATIDRLIGVNLYGPLRMVRAFLPHLLDRPEAHIANVSSMGGFLAVPGQTVYGATKAAVKLLSEGLYAELSDTRVGVTAIMPGAVRTSIAEHSGVDLPPGASEDAAARRSTSPEDAAKAIVDGIEHDRFHVFVGNDSRLMSLANRLAPKWSTRMIRRKMKDLVTGGG